MKRIYFALACIAVAGRVPAQPVAPAVTSLGAYTQLLQAPARVAADPAGYVYVTDPKAGQVVVFDAFGRVVTTQNGFAQPLGIAVDPQGKIYLAEEQTGSVSVFDAQWHLLYKLGHGNEEFQLPNHIALDPTSGGDTVYVSDSTANRIKVYAGATLTHWFGGAGSGNGQFDFPSGVCVSSNGEVFVVDQNNDRIQVFDRAGSFLRSFGLGSTTPSGRSQAVIADSAGRLYVADTFQGIVKVLDAASGALLSSAGSFGQLPGQLDSPAGLALDALNRLFATSANTHRLELYGLDAFVHLTTQPASQTIPAGANLVFTAVTSGTGSFAFQWRMNGAGIPGATNETFTIVGAATTNTGDYSVVITGSSGAITSSVAPVAVMGQPKIISGPESLAVLRGSSVELVVSAAGSALSYQWLLNGLHVDGATNWTLALPDVQSFQAGLYSVQVSNTVGAVVSVAARLTVIVPPSVMEIVSSAVDTNQMFHLTVNADPGFSYWLDASTDLFEWQPLANFTDDIGLIEFIDADSTNYWNRFYRLRWLP